MLVEVVKTKMLIKKVIDYDFGLDIMVEKNAHDLPLLVCWVSIVDPKSFWTKVLLL